MRIRKTAPTERNATLEEFSRKWWLGIARSRLSLVGGGHFHLHKAQRPLSFGNIPQKVKRNACRAAIVIKRRYQRSVRTQAEWRNTKPQNQQGMLRIVVRLLHLRQAGYHQRLLGTRATLTLKVAKRLTLPVTRKYRSEATSSW